MSQFRDAIQRSDQHIKSLRIACAFLVLLVLITSTGWMFALRDYS